MPPAARKKAPKKPKRKGGDRDAPTEAQWAKMEQLDTFFVVDRKRPEEGTPDESDEGKDEVVYCSFSVGQIASILPTGVDPDDGELSKWEWWLCKILEIRKSNMEENCWVKVQWFYSGDDISAVWPKANPFFCQLWERAFSTHEDIISSQCFESVIDLKDYDESAIDQELIEVRKEYYSRFQFDEKKPRITIRRKARPTSEKYGTNTCVCSEPYDPLDTSSYMHFCPRPRCRRAYHEECLVRENSFVDEAHGRSYRRLLLFNSPYSDDLEFDPIPRPNKRRRKTNGDGKKDKDEDFDAAINALDQDLVNIAACPAVKGLKLKLPHINGNIEQVCKAREMIYEMLQEQRERDDWREELDMKVADTARDAITKITKSKKATKAKYKFCCPRCKSPI